MTRQPPSLQSSCLDKICQHSLPTSSLPPLLVRAVSRHKRNKVFAGNFQYVYDETEATIITIQPGDREDEAWLFTLSNHHSSSSSAVSIPTLRQFSVVEGESLPFFSPFVECDLMFPGTMMGMEVELNCDITGVLRWRGGNERAEFSSSWYFSQEEGSRRLVHRAEYTTRGGNSRMKFTDMAIESQVDAEKAYSDNVRMNEENQQTQPCEMNLIQ